MKDFSLEQKKQLRDKIVEIQKDSGLSANKFAEERLGFSNGSKFSHVINNWNKPKTVGLKTWLIIDKHISTTQEYKGVFTENLIKVWDECDNAYRLRRPLSIIGDAGTGKTFALTKYKKHLEKTGEFKVIYFDASLVKTNKQFISGLMKELGCYKPGTMAAQLIAIRKKVKKDNPLILIDEVSSMEGHKITIIKDVITAVDYISGIIIAGTPYLFNNLNRGAIRSRHLFDETRDRIFQLPVTLERPTKEEALEIFQTNGITSKEDLDIVMARNDLPISHSWLAKKTFRGIKDCIDMIKMADMPKRNYDNITL